MTRVLSWCLLAVCAVIAAGGYYQVLESPIFWCGRTEAFPATTILALISGGQTALYLASAASPNWARPYRISQLMVLPFVAIGLFQIFYPYPGTVLFFTVLTAIPLTLVPRRQWMQPHLPAICGLFVVSTLGFLAAFGEIPFTLHGVVAPRWLLDLAAIAAAGVSVPVIGSMRRELPAAGRIPDIARFIPLALLLFAVLRGKLPDIAYDSLTYKTTLPYQLAEWRTGDTAIPDVFMLGTNLQEMLNGLLVAITRDYLPPFISTISFVLLLLITPLAFPVERRGTAAGRAVVAFAAVSAFVLSEAGTAQGTSYQEPLLLLFLVASLIRCPMWPAFLAVAIGVKISAAFIAPVVVAYHVFGYRRFFISPGRLAIAALAGALVLVPQFGRNVIFSGRIFGMDEALATHTDPPGPNQILAAGENRYDTAVRGGIVNNARDSACNIWLLAALCSTGYKGVDTDGFHVFPASRAPLLALCFAAFVLVGGVPRPAGVISVLLFVAGYAGFLAFLSQGRYFLPLSFCFPVLLLLNPERAEAVVRSLGPSWPGRLVAVGLGCWFLGSDLLPGTFTNVSWICRRPPLAAATLADLRHPETPLQHFLVSYVDRYKATCPPPGLPPVILAEHDVLNSPYLGTQRIFHVFSQVMIQRFFAADRTRQDRAGQAIIAVVSRSPGYASSTLGTAEKDYTPCFHDDTLQVMCSNLLAPVTQRCATSLYPP
ncbi:hypothetical protein [Acidisphaera sp. S103]|uniref:hypothetical protein n=1 Tax=Acidisphaera sp. S103 TaxID=1747223 RepID=UPI00131B5BB3|nr:hypothetical protein [Acidisphaera sp. S103]